MSKINITGACYGRSPVTHEIVRIFDSPCLAAIDTSGKQTSAFASNRVTAIGRHIVSLMKADKNFILPNPDTTVGRPATKSTRLVADDNVSDGHISNHRAPTPVGIDCFDIFCTSNNQHDSQQDQDTESAFLHHRLSFH
jgi:hypothetical protein